MFRLTGSWLVSGSVLGEVNVRGMALFVPSSVRAVCRLCVGYAWVGFQLCSGKVCVMLGLGCV